MEIKRGNKSQDGLLASKLSGGKKDFDFSQLNPLEWEFLGGDRKMDISGTWQNIKDAWGSGGDDSKVRHYTQAGGDAGGLEELYNQREREGLGYKPMEGPKLPYQMWKPGVEMPEFVKSQQKSYKDPEKSEKQFAEEEFLKQSALDQQTPSLAPPEAGMLASLLGQDTDSGLAHAGGSVATVEDKAAREKQFADMSKRLDLKGITDRIGTPTVAKPSAVGPAEQFGRADRHPGMPQQSLLSAAPGMEEFDDDMGNALNPEEEDEGIMARLGSLMSSDSSKTKPLSKSKQAGIKIATDLLTGSGRETPIQRAPVAGVKMGSVAFPGLLAASQRPVNPRYTPKGLG